LAPHIRLLKGSLSDSNILYLLTAGVSLHGRHIEYWPAWLELRSDSGHVHLCWMAVCNSIWQVLLRALWWWYIMKWW